jgi:hypothetical protein
MVVGGINVAQSCPADNRDYIAAMIKIALLVVLAVALVAGTGCKSHSGSREFIPGKGWVPND